MTLFNEERPPVWEQVSDWIDRNGPIANVDLCQIANVDMLKASKMLRRWFEQGILIPVEGRAKRNMAYRKPVLTEMEREPSLLSDASDNKDAND